MMGKPFESVGSHWLDAVNELQVEVFSHSLHQVGLADTRAMEKRDTTSVRTPIQESLNLGRLEGED